MNSKYMITLGDPEKQQSLSGKPPLALSELPYDFEGEPYFKSGERGALSHKRVLMSDE